MPGHETVKGCDPFDDLAESLRAHPFKSQILIEVRPEQCTLEKALAVLEDLNIHQVQHQVLQKGDPSCILFFLPNEDMREAVFKLTEAGFTRVQGVNPQPKHWRKRN
jgi:hypothetical protein